MLLSTSSPSIKPTYLPSIRPTRIPTNQPTIRPTYVPSQIPTLKPTLKPTRKPTNYPTLSKCSPITVVMTDTHYDGWSGNYLTIVGTSSDITPITLEMPSSYYSYYSFLCLPDDVYTAQCCHGNGGYNEISWTISGSGISITGIADSVCEDTTETFTVQGNYYDDDSISVPNSFVGSVGFIVLLSVTPIAIICLVFCCVGCSFRRKTAFFRRNNNNNNNSNGNNGITQLAHQMTPISSSNQGRTQQTPPVVIISPTFTPQPATIVTPPPSAPPMSSKPVNFYQTPTSPFNPNANFQSAPSAPYYATNPINPSAPPISTNTATTNDVLLNAFPEFYSNKDSTYSYR